MSIKHIALFRAKAGTPPEQIAQIFANLMALTKTIPGLLDCSAGVNCSVEGLAQGFTHGFVMTFRDAACRDAYLPHPDHEAVKQQLLAIIDGGADGVVVVDWSAGEPGA